MPWQVQQQAACSKTGSPTAAGTAGQVCHSSRLTLLLSALQFAFDVIVLAVTGTAWAQALPIQLADYLGTYNSAFISRHQTAYDWR